MGFFRTCCYKCHAIYFVRGSTQRRLYPRMRERLESLARARSTLAREPPRYSHRWFPVEPARWEWHPAPRACKAIGLELQG